MIDWNSIDKSSPGDWIRLAEALCQKVIAAIQGEDPTVLKQLQDDIGDVALNANLSCPANVLSNLNAANRQVASALIAIDLKDLASRNAQLDAAGAKVSVAVNALRTEAANLRLTAVSKAIDDLTGIVKEVRQLRDQIDSTPKKDIPAKADAILSLLEQLYQRLQTATQAA